MANGGRDRWEKFQSFAVGAGAIAVPIAVAWIGAGFNNATKEAEIRLKTVEIAVGILETEPVGEEESPLRDWAIDVVDQYSGVPIPPSVRAELQRNSLPVVANFIGLDFKNPDPEVFGEYLISMDDEADISLPAGKITARLTRLSENEAILIVLNKRTGEEETLWTTPDTYMAMPSTGCFISLLGPGPTAQSARFVVACSWKSFSWTR